MVAFVSGVPFVGFGMMDNAIMIVVSELLHRIYIYILNTSMYYVLI